MSTFLTGKGGSITSPLGTTSAVEEWSASLVDGIQKFNALGKYWDASASCAGNQSATASISKRVGVCTLAVSGVAQATDISRVIVNSRMAGGIDHYLGSPWAVVKVGNISGTVEIWSLLDSATVGDALDATISSMVITCDDGTITITNARCAGADTRYGNGQRYLVNTYEFNGPPTVTESIVLAGSNSDTAPAASSVVLEAGTSTNGVTGSAYIMTSRYVLDKSTEPPSGEVVLGLTFTGVVTQV